MISFSEKQTILIVDDNRESIQIVVDLLKSDYLVRGVTSAEKALQIVFSNRPPDLILLNVMIPELDGYVICKQIKEHSAVKDIPIIFITGKISDEDELYGFEIGAIDYITKPYKPVVVKARIHAHTELKRHRDRHIEMMDSDMLTGIANIRKFNEYLALTWNFAARESVSISLMLIDIDFFTQYNHYFGHQEGDDCIIQISQVLSDAIQRKTDFVARLEGGRFACILQSTGMNGALKLADKVRLSISSLHIPHPYAVDNGDLTVSIGVASGIPERGSNEINLVTTAETALLKAKKSGRNKTNFYSLAK